MLIQIHPKNPQERNINMIIDTLKKGGVIIYPTDTIYGLGCDINNAKAIERVCRIKGIKPDKAQLSFVCADLSHLSAYAKPVTNAVFRLLKEHLPGPYTFILEASKQVPKILKHKKDTIGLRVPDNVIAINLVEALGNPILSASLPGDMVEEYTDPEIIYEKYQNLVDIVIDGGIGGFVPSTIVDCTGSDPTVLREGAGEWNI